LLPSFARGKQGKFAAHGCPSGEALDLCDGCKSWRAPARREESRRCPTWLLPDGSSDVTNLI
jgi:hypothetical protein